MENNNLSEIELERLEQDEIAIDIDNIFCMWMLGTFVLMLIVVAVREGWL